MSSVASGPVASPWGRRDGFVSAVLALLGVVIVGLCWNGASREEAFRDQIGWTVGALAGCAVFALAGGFWLLVGFRRTRRCLARLQADSTVVFDLRGSTATADLVGPVVPGAPAPLVTADGMRLVHHPDCLLARGKAVRPVASADHLASCSMCALAVPLSGTAR